MNTPPQLSLIPFDARCLELSWNWLNDPEIRELTQTPVFSRADQEAFFKSLPLRPDYAIWGVILNGTEVIGAAGLKNHRGTLAEYWGYIGAKQYWNKGLGRSVVRAIEQKALELNFVDLDLKVAAANLRAIALYEKTGFVIEQQSSTESCLRMVKWGIR